eukprot:356637-Prymnesium_polylepis.1
MAACRRLRARVARARGAPRRLLPRARARLRHAAGAAAPPAPRRPHARPHRPPRLNLRIARHRR